MTAGDEMTSSQAMRASKSKRKRPSKRTRLLSGVSLRVCTWPGACSRVRVRLY
jgi:hypothetical protein